MVLLNSAVSNALGIFPAACNNNNSRVSSLLKDDPNAVNLKDSSGKTALHHASYCNSPSVAKKLLDSGADIDSRDFTELQPVHYAAASGAVKIMKVRNCYFLQTCFSVDLCTIQYQELSDIKGYLFMHSSLKTIHSNYS
jgi:ankyrin repeat protein